MFRHISEKNRLKNVNCQAGLQASYISSSLACVSEVSVVKGGRWKKKVKQGGQKEPEDSEERKNASALTAACRL